MRNRTVTSTVSPNMINPSGAWISVTSNETVVGAVMTPQLTPANTTIPVRTTSNSSVGAFIETSRKKRFYPLSPSPQPSKWVLPASPGYPARGEGTRSREKRRPIGRQSNRVGIEAPSPLRGEVLPTRCWRSHPGREAKRMRYPQTGSFATNVSAHWGEVLVRHPHVQHRQLLRQAPNMVEDHVVAHAEDAGDVAVGLRVEAHAVSEDAVAVVLLHGFFCVEYQILRVVHVDVRGLAV